MTRKWQQNRFRTSRRRFLGSAAGAAALGAFWGEQDLLGWQQNVRTASKPSDLKITDLRVAHVVGAPMRCPLIRIETNQGIHGLGEVRDGASPTYALMLKSRLVGENPCDVDRIFRKIKQFGFHARAASSGTRSGFIATPPSRRIRKFTERGSRSAKTRATRS